MEDSQSKVLIVVTLRVCNTPNENQVIGIKLLEIDFQPRKSASQTRKIKRKATFMNPAHIDLSLKRNKRFQMILRLVRYDMKCLIAIFSF